MKRRGFISSLCVSDNLNYISQLLLSVCQRGRWRVSFRGHKYKSVIVSERECKWDGAHSIFELLRAGPGEDWRGSLHHLVNDTTSPRRSASKKNSAAFSIKIKGGLAALVTSFAPCYIILKHNAPPLSCVLCFICFWLYFASVRQWALSALGAKHGAPFFGHSSEQKSTLCVCRRRRRRVLALWQRRRCELCGLLALIYAHCNFSVSFQLIFFAPARPPTRKLLSARQKKKREKWQLLRGRLC